MENVTGITLSDPSVDQSITFDISNGDVRSSFFFKYCTMFLICAFLQSKNFKYFQQEIDDAFFTIENVWKELKDVELKGNEKDNEPKEKESKIEEVIPKKDPVEEKKSTASNPIKDKMRERQQLLQKQREEQEAKIKAKLSASKPQKNTETSTGTSKSNNNNISGKNIIRSFDHAIHFLQQFCIVFVILWICSFIMPNLVIESWRGHLAASTILASLKVVLDLENLADVCAPLLATKVKYVCTIVFVVLIIINFLLNSHTSI